MSFGRDPGVPEGTGEQPSREAADDQPHAVPTAGQPGTAAAFTDAEFIGPLLPGDQAWCEHTLRADTSAALFEPADNVIRRREAHISGLYRMATLLSLSGDLGGGGAAGFRAIAESRALAEFLAASPDYCLDCFLLADRCPRHQRSQASVDKAGAGSAGAGSSGSGAGSGSRSSGAESGSGFGSGGASPAGSGSVDPGAGSSSGTGRPRATGGRTAGSPGSTPEAGRKAPGHQPGHEPEWRRFGADEFPSASG